MKWFLYNLLFTIAYVVMMPKFLFRMLRRGGYANHFADRFGRFDDETVRKANDGKCRIWVHAVSVGEVAVASQLMQELRKQAPNLAFILSTTSSTGWTQAQRCIGPDDILIHNPLDYPGCVNRALTTLHPIAYILTETEIWPNILRLVHERSLPCFLVNGRISDHSAPGYKRLKCWFGPVLNTLNKVYAQSELDAQRFRDADCQAERIEVTGSMKFDVAHRNPAKEAELRAYLTAAGFDPKAPVLLGGSTWPGEDKFLLEVYKAALETTPSLRLILAPRHFEKANDVERNILDAGLPCIRKSKTPAPTAQPANAVLLADTTGELMGFYGLADVAFVGKSLCEHGAQNMIEPCLCQCATVVGPYTENFRPVMSDLLQQGAIVQAKDAEELRAQLLDLLAHPDKRAELGEKASAAVQTRLGVTPHVAADILKSI